MARCSVDLVPHPTCAAAVVDRVTVGVEAGPGRILLTYTIEGDIQGLVIPAPRPPGRADELWRTTCVELFVKRPEGRYREFNVSPSGLWASYDFSGYREGMVNADTPSPEVAVRHTDRQLVVEVGIGTLQGKAALSAVIEATDGTRAYWALAHPSDKPDFHHPDSFVLDLP
jgi:hypothetical protein